MHTHWPIGCMLWRIGPILDLEEQVNWVHQHGFDAIGLHAHPGAPGDWRGLDPAATDATGRQRWRELLAPFTRREIHAPIPNEITATSQANISPLVAAIELAHDLNAQVVTVHAQTPADPGCAPAAWKRALLDLDQLASEAGVSIGLELMGGFDWLERLPLAHTGLTLDVGHMYHHDRAAIRPYGSLGNLVRAVRRHLVHVHVHDISPEEVDHIEINKGIIPFHELVSVLAEVGYGGMLCLELNPDRVPPEGILRSRERLLQAIRD